jgi:tetratricopeptide (TPR) repeat protein
MKYSVYIITIIFLFSCSSKQKSNTGSLELPFSVDGKNEAMPAFQNGLRLLHNFEYEDAAEAFIEAQTIDPDFTMAYWGEAMTHNHAVWGDLDIDKARNTLAKLGNTKEERVAKGKSKLEQDFITSLEILYGVETKKEREIKYSEYLSNMYSTYDGELEVGAFYALSLLGLKSMWTEMEDYNFKAEKIAREILAQNPVHPGALHYLIHSNDHPDYADKALAAARDYAKVASYAGHALHMPSHIYLALGMWDDVVNSNEVSWQSSLDRKEKKQLDNDALDYHAHVWLSYGYLQQGRYDDALQVINNQKTLTNELPSPRARYQLTMMKGHYLIETSDLNSEIASLEVKTDDLSFYIKNTNDYINATKAFYAKDTQALEGLISKMENDIAIGTQLKSDNESITVCGVTAYLEKIPTESDLNNGEIFLGQLKAMLAWVKNDAENAETLFKAVAQKSRGALVGPPEIIKPTQELFGEFYLALGKYELANEQFQEALKRAPNRILSLKGQLTALNKLGDKTKAEEIQNKLNLILKSSEQQAASL